MKNEKEYLEAMETNKKITAKIIELVEKQRKVIDDMLFLMMLDEDGDEIEDD